MIFKLNKRVKKDLKKIKEKYALAGFRKFLKDIEQADSLSNLKNVKKIKGEKYYYRYKFGDYRVGFKIDNDQILVLKVAHRKEIYRKFP